MGLEYQQASRKKTEPLTSSLLAAESNLERKWDQFSVFDNEISLDNPCFDKKRGGITVIIILINKVNKTANGN